MGRLAHQIQGIIKTCKATIRAKSLLYVTPDENTINIARALLKEVQLRHPNDEVLKAVSLDGFMTWDVLEVSMRVILPFANPEAAQQRGEGGGSPDPATSER